MNERLQQAVETIRNAGTKAPFDEESYLAACETVVTHRADLTQRVFINLPGGLSGNDERKWANVKANSDERCGCGNERTIKPLNPRTEYRPSGTKKVLAVGDELYLKPKGGDKASTFMMFTIDESPKGPALVFVGDPFAPLVFTMDMLSKKGYPLSQLADVLPKQKEPAVMVTGKEKTPVCAVLAADVTAGTVTIEFDADVEGFDKTEAEAMEEGHKHE